MGPQRGCHLRHAVAPLLLDAGHVWGRVDPRWPLPGERLLRDQPPAATPESPTFHVHSGGVGRDPTWGPRGGGHGGAVVLGPGGRTPPPGQRHVVALCRFACACWRFFRGGLRRCGLVAGIGCGTPCPARRGPEPPPPPPAQPPSCRACIVVQPAPQQSWGLSAPLQPTLQHLLRLLEGAPRPTGVMSLSCPFAEREVAPLRAAGAQQLRPRSGVSQWPVQDKEATFKELLVLGVTAEEARDIAGAALGQWEAVQAVSTIVLVQSATKAQCSVARLLRALRLFRADLEVQGGILHYQPLTHRGPWECSTAASWTRC